MSQQPATSMANSDTSEVPQKNRAPSAPRRFKPRVRRGAGGHGDRSKGREKPFDSQLIPPVRPVDSKVPNPQNKSKSSTPLSNDPLYLESFVIEGDQCFVEEAGRKVFSPSFECLVSLIERTYAQVCTTDKEFQRYVSLSMYMHFHMVQLHARIAVIRQHTGKTVEDENNLIRLLKSEEYPVHEPINAYRRGIGDFEDTSGTYHHFSIRQVPQAAEHEGITGFYGRVDENSHVLYECYPSPGVAALRIVKDYLYTNDRNRDPIWNLPATIRPLEQVVAQPEDTGANEIEPNEGDAPLMPLQVPQQQNAVADAGGNEQ